jgi:hypothetical protein
MSDLLSDTCDVNVLYRSIGRSGDVYRSGPIELRGTLARARLHLSLSVALRNG